ncbi:MFS transporter [Nocardia fluminea]|uniref:MFS transporter n=1 Tax=Nocardia fluminea TaxID=134984 RepID=UPI0033EBB509
MWHRKLERYPSARQRYRYLAITVLSTVVAYYELYIHGAVATMIIGEFDLTFTQYVMISVIGTLLGAFASLAAGLADRWGRANLVTIGLFVTSSLVRFGMPQAANATTYALYFAGLSIVEGMILVATPALIRDFSPQWGRASAMGFWTFGPVLGSLLVTAISSNTLASHPDWQFQFRLCGTIGLATAVVALLGLRELSPALRDQLMISLRDRALIEARAAGIDRRRAYDSHWRQVLKPDVLVSSVAISVYLVFYYISVGFFVVYFSTVFGYTEARANALANWYWASTAVALVVSGLLSDKLRVRKPFMVVGALLSAGAVTMFRRLTTEPDPGSAVPFFTCLTPGSDTRYYVLASVLVIIGVGTGLTYCAWMACFTEAVERHNPAATATGLALWAWINRIIVTVALAAFTIMLPAASTLVDQGHHLKELTTEYREQLETLRALEPSTVIAIEAYVPSAQAITAATTELVNSGVAADAMAARARIQQLRTQPVPLLDQQFIRDEAAAVAQAEQDNPAQWQRWWLVCAGAQLAFVPLIFIMGGRWRPKRAREDAARHEAYIEKELRKLARTGNARPSGPRTGRCRQYR